MNEQKMQKPIDVCILDFDNCLYPGISKVHAFVSVVWLVMLAPKQINDWALLPHLGFSGVYLLALRLRQQVIHDITDGQLVQMYQEAFSSIPRHYFKRAAGTISKRVFPGALETIAFVSRVCPVGIISLAIIDVLEAVNQRLMKEYSFSLAFIHGNELTAGDNPKQVLTAEDKRRLMQTEVGRLGCKSPLVVGHDEEDLGMVALAREMGGISVGLNPNPHISHYFDYFMEPNDWCDVPPFFSALFSPRKIRKNQ